jgi:hypothetical protein
MKTRKAEMGMYTYLTASASLKKFAQINNPLLSEWAEVKSEVCCWSGWNNWITSALGGEEDAISVEMVKDLVEILRNTVANKGTILAILADESEGQQSLSVPTALDFPMDKDEPLDESTIDSYENDIERIEVFLNSQDEYYWDYHVELSY